MLHRSFARVCLPRIDDIPCSRRAVDYCEPFGLNLKAPILPPIALLHYPSTPPPQPHHTSHSPTLANPAEASNTILANTQRVTRIKQSVPRHLIHPTVSSYKFARLTVRVRKSSYLQDLVALGASRIRCSIAYSTAIVYLLPPFSTSSLIRSSNHPGQVRKARR